MNAFLFSAITLCLAAQCALAQYQSAAQAYGNGYLQHQQRKMAPTPQTYGQQQQQQQQQGYEMAAPQQSAYEPQTSYKSPSQYSTGDSYAAKPAAYRQQAASNYAKPAPKYEEPYHPPMPFAWGYDINDGYGGAQYHKENGDEYGKRTGSYGYTDAYGIYRQVDYVADEHGFRATIKTNEPGTANESPADVELHAYEPPSNYYAGQSSSSYSAPAPAPAQAARPVSSYSAPAPAPAATAYSAPAPMSAYAAAPAPAKRYQPAASKAASVYPQRSSGYESSSQYSSGSSLVPSYQPKQQQQQQLRMPSAYQQGAAKRY